MGQGGVAAAFRVDCWGTLAAVAAGRPNDPGAVPGDGGVLAVDRVLQLRPLRTPEPHRNRGAPAVFGRGVIGTAAHLGDGHAVYRCRADLVDAAAAGATGGSGLVARPLWRTILD